MTDVLRFGIAGWNDAAFETYQAIDSVDDAEVAAVMVADPGARRDLAQIISTPLVSALDDLLATPGLQAVYTALPAEEREEIVLAAVRAGKAVLLDAPLAADTRAATELLEACPLEHCVIGLIEPWSVDAGLAASRLLLRAGLFGDLVTWRATSFDEGVPNDPLMAALSTLGLFRYLTGLEAEQVWAQAAESENGAVSIVLSVRYENGCLGTLHLGSGFPGGSSDDLMLYGPLGQLDLSDEPRAYRTQSTEDAPARTWRPVRYAGPRGSVAQAVAQFVRRVAAGENPPLPAHEALPPLRIVDAARRSLETGAIVPVAH